MRKRLIIAFTVVALAAALASAWLTSVVVPFFPSLQGLVPTPKPLLAAFIPALHQPQDMIRPRSLAAVAYFLTPFALLLAAIVGLAFAASRRVLQPVRRLAHAAERISGGDLSVRIEPRGRDELARLVASFNEMASTLESKVRELQQMEARARQFAADVSHELRTPLTAMVAVTDVLGEAARQAAVQQTAVQQTAVQQTAVQQTAVQQTNVGLTGDGPAAARLVREEILHLSHLVDDLIEISRFDAGTAQLVTDETDIAMAIGRCMQARGWDDVRICAPAGLMARVDRRRFDVIIANLVGNALRHASPPVTVTAGLQPDGQGGQGGQHLAVAVRDHGPACLPPPSRTSSTGSTRPTPRGPARRAAAWAWRSPGRTRGCMAGTSKHAITQMAAPCSPSSCEPEAARRPRAPERAAPTCARAGWRRVTMRHACSTV